LRGNLMRLRDVREFVGRGNATSRRWYKWHFEIINSYALVVCLDFFGPDSLATLFLGCILFDVDHDKIEPCSQFQSLQAVTSGLDLRQQVVKRKPSVPNT
jgi:hypothetical protein